MHIITDILFSMMFIIPDDVPMIPISSLQPFSIFRLASFPFAILFEISIGCDDQMENSDEGEKKGSLIRRRVCTEHTAHASVKMTSNPINLQNIWLYSTKIT